jgi:hypothetical protein
VAGFCEYGNEQVSEGRGLRRQLSDSQRLMKELS